jgi:hypothetical protein
VDLGGVGLEPTGVEPAERADCHLRRRARPEP